MGRTNTFIIDKLDIEKCREAHKSLIGRYDNTNKREPVIVISTNHLSLGVQFWNDREISRGHCVNADGTQSLFVEKL